MGTITMSFGQELTCVDFKNGTFDMYTLTPPLLEWQMTRTGNTQIETITKIPEEFKDLGYPMGPKGLRIEWIDECTYKLFAEDSNGELDEISQLINDSGGIFTEFIKIEDNCFYYKSTCTIEGEAMVSEGKICKN